MRFFLITFLSYLWCLLSRAVGVTFILLVGGSIKTLKLSYLFFIQEW